MFRKLILIALISLALASQTKAASNFDGQISITKIGNFSLSGNNTISGSNVFTGRTTFGSAAAAANAVEFNATAGCITFEGSTADAFNVRLCAVNPTATFTLSLPVITQGQTLAITGAQTFTGIQTFSQAMILGPSFHLNFGGNSSAFNSIRHVTSTTPDLTYFHTGTTSNSWIISERQDTAIDENGPCLTAACTDPTIVMYDNTSAAGLYGAIWRDTDSFNLNAGTAYVEVNQSTIGNEVFRLTSVATNDDPRESTFQYRVATTDGVATTIATIPIPSSTTVGFLGRITARRTGGSSGTAEDGAFYELKAVYKNSAGTAVAIGAAVTVVGESQAAWDVTATVSSGNVLLQVTGAANNNVTWHCTLYTYPVGS